MKSKRQIEAELRERKAREVGSKPTESQWGKISDDYYGYGNEEDRRKYRGLEDWELVEKMDISRKRVPVWFFVVIAIVLLAAFGLSLPFWGDRPDHPRHWLTWGHLLAVGYLFLAGGFIYLMVNVFNPKGSGDEACDPSQKKRGNNAESNKT